MARPTTKMNALAVNHLLTYQHISSRNVHPTYPDKPSRSRGQRVRQCRSYRRQQPHDGERNAKDLKDAKVPPQFLLVSQLRCTTLAIRLSSWYPSQRTQDGVIALARNSCRALPLRIVLGHFLSHHSVSIARNRLARGASASRKTDLQESTIDLTITPLRAQPSYLLCDSPHPSPACTTSSSQRAFTSPLSRANSSRACMHPTISKRLVLSRLDDKQASGAPTSVAGWCTLVCVGRRLRTVPARG